jgi:hypothetical protein
MNSNKPTLEKLLEIENDQSFLDFRCSETGYLLWPLLRNQFFRILISDIYYNHGTLVGKPSASRYRYILQVLPRVILHNAKHGKFSGDILIMGSGAGHFQRDGLWFNRITDYFALAFYKDTVTCEGIVDWHVPEPRHNKQSSYWLPWQILIALAGKLQSKHRHVKVVSAMLDHARRRTKSLLGLDISDENIQLLLNMTVPKVARLSFMRWVYRRFLTRTAPRLVLVEQSCFGDYGIFNHVAREMGIRVAEPQHGMVSAGHDAYSFAPAIRDSDEYRQYLPHDFLGYGSWWNAQINAPVQKYAIGNPHYTEQSKCLDNNLSEKLDLLLLSDGIEFSIYVSLAINLANLLGSKIRVVLRPHPLERKRVYAAYPNGKIENVVIDSNRDVYQSFSSARVVVGEGSTVLFEAIGLVEMIFMWKTPKATFYYPTHPFSVFTDAHDLAAQVIESNYYFPSLTKEKFWAKNWQKNFQDYLDLVLQSTLNV